MSTDADAPIELQSSQALVRSIVARSADICETVKLYKLYIVGDLAQSRSAICMNPIPESQWFRTCLRQAYIFLAAPLSWVGLFKAHVHPALSLLNCSCSNHIGIPYTQLKRIAVEGAKSAGM